MGLLRIAGYPVASMEVSASAGVDTPWWRMPVNFVRFNISALMATSAELPDIARAAQANGTGEAPPLDYDDVTGLFCAPIRHT